jgi:hypothetical protein
VNTLAMTWSVPGAKSGGCHDAKAQCGQGTGNPACRNALCGARVNFRWRQNQVMPYLKRRSRTRLSGRGFFPSVSGDFALCSPARYGRQGSGPCPNRSDLFVFPGAAGQD